MTTTTGATETWQPRITHELAAQLRDDAKLLGLDGRTEIVKADLQLLRRRDFYAEHEQSLPVGVRPKRREASSDVTA
jgi:hypothetical protein